MKKYLVISIILIIMLSACSDTSANSQVESKNKLTILQGVDATTLDPIMHTDSPTGNIEYQLFDTLLKRDTSMQLVPNLASEYESLEDNKWRFVIRDDVYFHDGEKLKVEDVIYSIERILSEEINSPRKGYYNSIINMEQLSDEEFLIKTAYPNPVLLSRLAELRIVPKHYIEEVGNSEFSQNPIGSGPYVFASWIKDDEIKLKRNDNYWGEKARIEEVVFKPIPETSSRVMALQAKQADIITNVPPRQIEEIEVDPDLEVVKVDSTRFIMLSFTMNNFNVKSKKVREAINLAIDRESIIKKILSNNATISTQPICNFDLGYNPEVDGYDYNLEKAKELLEESDSKNLELTLQSPNGRYLMDKEVAEAIKANLEEAGIKVELKFIDWGTYVSSIISGEISADLWLIGWGSSTFDAGTTLKQWLHTSQTMSQYKVSDEKNKEIDGAIDLGLSTVDDSERERIYQKIIEDISSDIPFVNLYQQQNIYGKSKNVSFTPRSDEIIDVSKIYFIE